VVEHYVMKHIHCHTLDVIITQDTRNIVSDVEVTDHGLCDHLGRMSRDHSAVNFTATIIRPAPNHKVVSFRKLRSVDVEKVKRGITDSTILHLYSGYVDELGHAYNNGLHSLMYKNAPLCTKKIYYGL